MAVFHLLWIIASGVGYISTEDTKPVYKEAKCCPELIKKILELGETYGNTDVVFQKAGITWIVAQTTNTPKYEHVSCLKYHTEGGGKITAFVDGVEKPVFVKEKGNRLTVEDDTNHHYKILSDDKKKIYSGYVCSNDGPEISDKLPSNIGLTVQSSTTEQDKKEALNRIEQLGFKLSKTFTC